MEFFFRFVTEMGHFFHLWRRREPQRSGLKIRHHLCLLAVTCQPHGMELPVPACAGMSRRNPSRSHKIDILIFPRSLDAYVSARGFFCLIGKHYHRKRRKNSLRKESAIIDDVRYHKSRPKSCRECFWWKNRKVGCTLGKENCYFLMEAPEKRSPCENCCYGPCVSFCMRKVLGKGEIPANA